MASPGSSIRSAARATFSAYRSLPLRWRLAGGSAALTFVILAAFAALVGVFTTNQLRDQFDNQVTGATTQLAGELKPLKWQRNGDLNCGGAQSVSLPDYVSTQHAQIRIFDPEGALLCTQNGVVGPRVKVRRANSARSTPDFPAPTGQGVFDELGYRVDVPSQLQASPAIEGNVWLLYAVPVSSLNHELARVRFFLLLGVLGGTILALLAGLATAQRAIRPIVELTEAAREIERTRDPSRHVPLPQADDEVAELARTLEGMLQSLDEARGGTEAMLDRQREFVADASHELRTPLTSVLASLELLAEELEGEQADTAQAALRSARRMRRLVGDLLLLARADAKRVLPRRPTALDEVLMEAASEIGPVAEHHLLQVDAEPAVVSGARDELHRLALNLIENAVKHTPPGTHIYASTSVQGDAVVLAVEDDGPGIPEELEPRVFERFVRGARDGGRGSGLGLSIVQAVAESYGGSVTLERPDRGGSRFVVRLPAQTPAREVELQVEGAGHTSTTTGSTIGRRRSRS
jgi:two-component system, OmpR family, sensor kinase